MINKTNLIKTFNPLNVNALDYLGMLYINIFEDFGMAHRIFYSPKNRLKHQNAFDVFAHKDWGNEIDCRVFLKKAIATKDEIKNSGSEFKDMIVFGYSSFEYLIAYDDDVTKFLIHLTLSSGPDSTTNDILVMTNDIDSAFNIVKSWIKPVIAHTDTSFGITAVDGAGYLYTSWYDYNNHEVDIKANYNDDIPYDKMCELLETENKTELFLFYGEPGTGKSTLIKHFISKYPDLNFVFMDGALLANIGQEKLMGYFLENQNTIFILEDCEKALLAREHYANSVMPVLLNLTDGIIADVLGIKLICTFNTSLNNIDKALLRKGRLSLKYEFKKLCKEKAAKLLNEANASQDMTLADIYNYKEENDYSKKKTTTIGFTV